MESILPAKDSKNTVEEKAPKLAGGIPLMCGRCGDTGLITKISNQDGIRKRLLTLGISEGQSVRISNISGGNIILDVKGSRIAICNELGRRIQFKPM